MQSKRTEIWVGLFLLIVLCSALFISLRVADLSALNKKSTYQLIASFQNIGSLKIRAPVKIGGVVIGRVTDISLDPEHYQPQVTMDIDQRYNNIPSSSTLSVKTAGLLGDQSLDLVIGFDDPDSDETSILGPGGRIQITHQAMDLESLIGQFLYKSDNSTETKKDQ